MKTKILIADKFPEQYLVELKNLDVEVENSPKLGEKDLETAAKDATILVVRSTIVNEITINNANNLKVIIRAGAGVNNIAIPTASAKGVRVANCPGKNSVAVAELAIGLMVSLDRKIPDNVNDFKNGKWNKAEYSKADGLKGKTLGVVGVGNIGKEVAKRATAFDMKVYGYDIVRLDDVQLEYLDTIEGLLPKCDVISIHLPANDKTKGIINKDLFGLMKQNAFLINTSRHAVIDEASLVDAIKDKNLRVALDVFKDEPEGKTGEVNSSSPQIQMFMLLIILAHLQRRHKTPLLKKQLR
ncbi:MAG: phosphoglycerate dehydrogenase [Ignavibacteriaceae bacterium]|nr:phosphoglycerate dehydrogenase [Ignavibacteriaceae bacterium]